MLSGRVPPSSEPNAWACALAARRRAGAVLLDLTETNPTAVGLGAVEPDDLAALATADAMRYRPEPCGLPVAREAVAAYAAARGARVEVEDIVLTACTSEAYAHLFRLLADPGERVLVPAPSYPLFEPLAAAEGVRVVPYRIAWDGGWHLDVGSLEAAAATPGARAVVVVQPNHPTGSAHGAAEVAALEDVCARHRLTLVSDEVFGDFGWDPARPLPTLAGERRVPTVVLSGLSKVCGLPQLKCGWMIVGGPEAARRELVRGLEWLSDLFLSVNGPVQHALPRLLAGRGRFQSRVRERLAVNRAALRASLERRPSLTWPAGEGGWVTPLRLPGTRGEEQWTLALLERDVVAHPGHFYDLEAGAFLVMSLIVEPAVFAGGLARLEALLGR